jgi:hypothetical protein
LDEEQPSRVTPPSDPATSSNASIEPQVLIPGSAVLRAHARDHSPDPEAVVACLNMSAATNLNPIG